MTMMRNNEASVAFYKAVKAKAFCCICNTKDEVQLHHVRPLEKVSEVIKIAHMGNMGMLIAEFNKCVGLCDTHHRHVHEGRIQGWMWGRFNNGRESHGMRAGQYMPYLDVLGIRPVETFVLPRRAYGAQGNMRYLP